MYFSLRSLLLVLFLPFISATSDTCCSSATTVNVDTLITGYIYGSEYNYFTFMLVKGRTYTITMYSAFDNWFDFFAPSQVFLMFGDDQIGKNGVITYTATSTGYYFLRGFSYWSAAGSYELVIADRSTCSHACQSCVLQDALCGICVQQYKCTSCSNTVSSAVIGGACHCDTTESVSLGTGCTACTSLDANCLQCSSTTACTDCSGSYLKYEAKCVTECPWNSYQAGTYCYGCSTLDTYCTTCNSSSTCLSCSNDLIALDKTCTNSCPGTAYNNNGLCTSCLTLDDYCQACNGSLTCTSCSDPKVALGSSCIDECIDGTYNLNGICTSCKTLDDSCEHCNNTGHCTGCSEVLVALGSTCISECPYGTYDLGGICTSCLTLDDYCQACNGSLTCTSCYDPKVALGSSCIDECIDGTYNLNGICTSCKTIDDSCEHCNSTDHCTGCSGVLVALGSTCISECPYDTFDFGGVCTSCTTLDDSCISCNSTSSCLSCGGGLVTLGSTCISYCPLGTYDNNGICTSCRTMDGYCSECSNNEFCSSCDNPMLIIGSNCVSPCPSGTQNTEGVCSSTAYAITISDTSSTSSYLAHFPAALVDNIQVLVVTTVTLEGVDTSVYNYTLTKKSKTVYQIDFQFTQSIPSTTLKLVYFLNKTPNTSNPLLGKWIATWTTKLMGYISESDKEITLTINQVVATTMKVTLGGAGSFLLFGGNPLLLWPLMNLFQAFYYLIFIDVNYPANLQLFLEIFNLGSLPFIPNPLDWFVKDIDQYNLPSPARYNQFNLNGLFLGNAGNELLFLSLVVGVYLISKIAKKWIRRLPMHVRIVTNKTIEWFEWSGIISSLLASYTDMTQAIFLQLKVLTFSSKVFTLSSLLAFVAQGFVVLIPIFLWFIIRKYEKKPESLEKFDALVGEYNAKKAAGRYFVPLWLLRRLIMCLSLVFLQGYPYVQINVLCTLMLISISHFWVFAPYNSKRENISNTLIEILFGFIHIIIYILIYDDNNPTFSDSQRLQLGWAMISVSGIILMIFLVLSLIDQTKEILKAIRFLKRLMSKPVKKKINPESHNQKENNNNNTEERIISQSSMISDDQRQILNIYNESMITNESIAANNLPTTPEMMINRRRRLRVSRAPRPAQIPLEPVSQIRIGRKRRIANQFGN